MKKILIPILLICLTLISLLAFEVIRNNTNSLASESQEKVMDNKLEEKSELKSQEENNLNSNKENTQSSMVKEEVPQIELIDIDGKGKNYQFQYNNQTFTATYTKDNWHIDDSYKIKDKESISKICEKLIEIHPIHGKDLKTYRTVKDLVYEWEQHNIAYELLPENSSWKKSAKNVDLDPKDQGKSLLEMYNIRTKQKIK